MKHLLFAFACASASISCFAADAPQMLNQVSPVSVAQPAARASDVQTVDGIMGALYEVISGGIGEQRNWNRMRSLFIPEARIMAIFPKKDNKEYGLRILSVSDYIANSGPRLMEVGFREKELARKTEQWGEMLQVMSSYETVEEKDNVKRRGINSLQLMYDGTRWWIISLLFEAERPQLLLPESFASSMGSR
ncbi:hypothetical protein RF679_09595 [Undibacterium cyanobacteriorum]|uniref:Nuclear transport factor 2 family protein n=1 Tax=Undibacterium cyanobacteriorum TaxID=3073561 RepID=A0ABY9RCD7_9BURK|nr:hypothetical protein [Undibacterium sp. 20NA77.5]WMW78920.1 hypothetical protein RF679_09595 [Undibacterium sp. 20NA77.5]